MIGMRRLAHICQRASTRERPLRFALFNLCLKSDCGVDEADAVGDVAALSSR